MKQSKTCKNQNTVFLAILLSSSGEMVVESCKLTPVCLTILRRVSTARIKIKCLAPQTSGQGPLCIPLCGNIPLRGNAVCSLLMFS